MDPVLTQISVAHAVLAIALGFVLYTYAGYPIGCWLIARLRPQPMPGDRLPRRCALRDRSAPAAPGPTGQTVTVVIAAYREVRTIADKIASLAAQDYPAARIDVVLACDGSDDGTQEAARQAGAVLLPGRLTVLDLPRGGKPAALNAAAAISRGEILVFTDARQRLNPEAISTLCADLRDPAIGIVSGELVLSGQTGAGAYWRYEAWIRKNEGRGGSVIGVSGALYAMPRALFQPIPPETVLDDLLVPMRVRARGLRVAFEPRAKAFDAAAEVGREFSRKARTLAGNYQLLLLLPWLLLPWRNPSWFGFVSHKLCRLLVPYALIALLLASAVLAADGGPLGQALLLAQVGCYGLAALGSLPVARRSALVRLCQTFVVLNAAAVVGLWRVLKTGRNQRWT